MNATVSSLPVSLPVRMGPVVSDQGTTFTLFSRHATRVWLMIFDRADAETPIDEFELDPSSHRIGDLWRIHIDWVRPGHFYAYRMEGTSSKGHSYYDPAQWLLDPYAPAVAGSPTWGDARGMNHGDTPRNGWAFPRGVVLGEDDFDWEGDAPINLPIQDTIFYEAHVRGMTVHESAGVAHPGTYRGLMEKIPYLKDLGITSIELLPIHEFNELEFHQEDGSRRHLRNFWGYSTQAFFAPNGRYAADGVCGQQVREFKEMVKAFHRAGIEVILDVVFNHTTEAGHGGPIYSFRGIDNDIYYMMTDHGTVYANHTGCGNTVNCNHPVVQDFILDCLRYWVQEMHIDGFRFDLASIFTRGLQGEVLEAYSIVDRIAEDPYLRDTKLVAEAWDASGLYQVGSFPHERWAEWNGRYRDDIRQYWWGHGGHLRKLASGLTGSPDLYRDRGWTPLKSVNMITCHDGFTLYDLVSYNGKHNEANHEHNRDGEDHNHSHNCGVEGPTDHPDITAERLRRMKNYLGTLLLSQGSPLLLAGDEFARTQQGNNNAYCQDNDISWVDWSRLDLFKELHAFVKEAIAFRKAHPLLRLDRFLTDDHHNPGGPEIRWLSPHGHTPDWDHGTVVACLLRGDILQKQPADDDLFIIFNPDDKPHEYTLPEPRGGRWQVGLHTQEKPPTWSKTHHTIYIDRRSLTVLTAPTA